MSLERGVLQGPPSLPIHQTYYPASRGGRFAPLKVPPAGQLLFWGRADRPAVAFDGLRAPQGRVS